MLKDKFTRAMVTGGAGFIGSHIIEELLKEGLEVVCVDNYQSGKKENVALFHDYDGFREIECDVTDYDALKQAMKDVDLIFHEAASKMTICLRDPRRDLEINAKGTFNVLELARDMGVKKVVHASTGSVYGKARIFPTDEEHPLNPASYYGVSKLAGEKYARLFCDLYGLNCSILRYFHVYGPRQEYNDLGGVVSIFGRKVYHNEPPVIFGDGTQQRSFTYVKDVVEINLLVAQADGTMGEAYNCASGVNVTVGELADQVKAYFGRPQLPTLYKDWKIGDIKDFDVSNQKIRALGYEFKTPFEKGLSLTLDWLKDYFGEKE